MQERDAFKLQSVGCNQWSKQKIMADIYGCPSDALPQSEPADADDEDDFDVKLESLKNVWEKAAPVFHEWFRKTRSQQFKDSLIMSARLSLGIEGHLSTNGFGRSTSQSKHETLATKYGVYYSSLLQLENFNPLRFTAIDPMHNLFLGTAKHVFKLWIEKNLLSKKDLKVLEDRISSFYVGTGIGRLPHRIASNYGGYMASQWKNWILI